MGRWRRWWAARSLRARMAVVVGVAAAVVLVVLGRLAVGVLASALVGAADAELRRHAEVAAVQLRPAPRPTPSRARACGSSTRRASRSTAARPSR